MGLRWNPRVYGRRAGARRRGESALAYQSSQQLFDYFALAQHHRPADGRLNLFCEVDSQGVQDRCVEILNVVGVFDELELIRGIFIGISRRLADDPATGNTAASQRGGEAV